MHQSLTQSLRLYRVLRLVHCAWGKCVQAHVLQKFCRRTPVHTILGSPTANRVCLRCTALYAPARAAIEQHRLLHDASAHFTSIAIANSISMAKELLGRICLYSHEGFILRSDPDGVLRASNPRLLQGEEESGRWWLFRYAAM